MKPFEFKLQEPYFKIEKQGRSKNAESFYIICINPLFESLNQAKRAFKHIKNNERKATDLNRVIKALEYQQDQKYSSERYFVLSYLYDIKAGSVPKKMVSDKK